MKKWAWAIIIVLLMIYCFVVWGWWQEGNRNEVKWESERASERAF